MVRVMTCIITKYLGPTNSRGSRVKATSYSGSVTIPWDHALDAEQNHFLAVQAFCAKHGMGGSFVRFDLPGGYGALVWVREAFRDESNKRWVPYERWEVMP